MKHSHGVLNATILPLLILAALAALGWYDYYAEVQTNKALISESQQQRSELEVELGSRQSIIDGLQAQELALQAELTQEKSSREELANVLEKTTTQKNSVETGLREEIGRALATVAELEKELEKRQIRIDKLRTNESSLQAELVGEKQSYQALSTRLQVEKQARSALSTELDTAKQVNSGLSIELDAAKQVNSGLSAQLDFEKQEISELSTQLNSVKQTNSELSNQLATEKLSREDLTAVLANTLADKLAIEENLKLEVKRVVMTTAELKTELEKRQATQQSLYQELSSISGEKSELMVQLEQEINSKQEIADLKNRLEQELNETRIEVSQLKNQMTVIKLTSDVLFASGSAQLKPAGENVLSIIAESLNVYPDRAVSIEGHTDDLPIKNGRFKSNWELSTARGLAAVSFLQRDNRVDPNRLRVVGYGEHRPLTSNETAAGRQRNRRIEIKILPPDNYNLVQN